MLLPDKHIKLSESILGLGSFVLQNLTFPKQIDLLWKDLQKGYTSKDFPSYHSFENLVLAIDFLYSIGVIEVNRQGKIKKCD